MRRLISVFTAAVLSLAVASTANAQTGGFAGTQKYREKNPAGGKGRSGGATMAARMLADNAGNTLLEVTTADFDNPSVAATGEFSKIIVSAIDANGAVMYSFNYNPTGGSYFKQTLQGVYAGQAFTIHGHIKTPTKKVGNVIVTTTVQKRPDLYAERIITPSRVPAAIPVTITGVITELNGQIGARADCVLYANDVEVDRSVGVWVDSGDSVSCAFSPTFMSLGAVNLKLKAESVSPGDWDMANNTKERLIEVSPLDANFDVATVEAVAVDVDNTTFAQQGRFVNTTLLTGYDWFYADTTDRNSDAFIYAAAALGITHVPFALQASATDGTATWLLERAVAGCGDLSVGYVNGRSYYTYVTGCGNLYVEVGSYAGVVTYASRALVRTFKVVAGSVAYDGPAQYVLNDVSTEVEDGNNLFRGNSWTIDVKVAAGPFIFSAPVTTVLNIPFDDGETTPTTCTGTAIAYTCTASSWRIAGRAGVGAFVRDIPPP